jgi:hypothetical protein
LLAEDTPVQQITWAATHGIAQRHWDVFRRYAELSHVYLLMRAGQPAAIPWIERAFPPRPYELGFLEVDPTVGLLLARGGARRVRVFAHGHYVLTPAVGVVLASGRAAAETAAEAIPGDASGGEGIVGGPFLGLNPRQPPLRVLFRERWAQAGVVVDRRTHRPFTAGYDLLAVLGEGDEFHRLQNVGAAASGAAPLGWRLGPGNDASTRFLTLVRQDLNRKLEGERVLDGTRGDAPGPGSSTGEVSRAASLETIVVFRPDGAVGLLRTPPGGWARLGVERVMAALHPGGASK